MGVAYPGPVIAPELDQLVLGIMTQKPRVSLEKLQEEIARRCNEEGWYEGEYGRTIAANRPHPSKDNFVASQLKKVEEIFNELCSDRAVAA